MDKEETSIERH